MVARRGISSFSVLLLTAVIAVTGFACLSQLRVQYAPKAPGNTVSVYCNYPGASPRVVESEVISKIESVLATIGNCTDVSSVSHNGYGYVTLKTGRRANVDAIRFEAASLIRNLWTSLPEGCSFPVILANGETGSVGHTTAISFNIFGSLPSGEIARYVNDMIVHPLSTIDGVNSVSFYGDNPYEWVITFDSDRASSLGITVSQIAGAIVDCYGENIIGMTHSSDRVYAVKLRNGHTMQGADFSDIPVANVEGRIIHLGEIATFSYQESLPTSYYRINGLNTLELVVTAAEDANLLNVVTKVKAEMQNLSEFFPEELSVRVSYDSSKYIYEELNKVYLRTGLCILILLLFVFLVNRSWRYMTVMALTLIVDILISVVLYFLTGLSIHIYTLAGITVSLGIIIDNSIVMIDHWTRCHNRSVFLALLSAVLTTVAALLVVLMLPEKDKQNLADFTYVIVINLCVSLAVAYLFVPALLEYLPVEGGKQAQKSLKSLRRIAQWNGLYERYINWGIAHRWVLVLGFLLAFGLPTCLLPDISPNTNNDVEMGCLKSSLVKIAQKSRYANNKDKVDRVLGSSFGLFNNALNRSNFYREPERERLSINAGMPEGCTAQQLNEVMRSMENYLAHFDEIEIFETEISSSRDGKITVYFTPESERTWIPHRIKSDIISMAVNFGGANWTVAGLDDYYFNNNIISDYRSNCIVLTGYNIDELMEYGEVLVDWLGENSRVRNAEIWGEGYYDRPVTEFLIDYDFEAMSTMGLNPYVYFPSLSSTLYDGRIMRIKEGPCYADVRLVSSSKDIFDAWHFDNDAVNIGSCKVKLSEVGSIIKHNGGFPIKRHNQEYTISVRYDFIGSNKISDKFMDDAVHYMNNEIFPTGYKAKSYEYRWLYENKSKYASLILLIIAIIFVICSVHFNSIKYPFVIIWMIPISFIGVFLAFGLTDFTFDKGGFAAFVMLSGITVNAGIYIVSELINEPERRFDVQRYIRAFDKKIRPISLTVLSTALGLVPFLFDGPKAVFWFPFAVGTISGLVFSVIAFVLYLPVFACSKTSASD